jgi:hypothetical protein
LGHALRFYCVCSLKNDLVHVSHRIHRILRRLVMMGRVVAHGHAVDVVQLGAVESPVANKFLGQLLVVSLHFRHGRTQCRQVARHTSMLAVLVEDEPIRMLLRHLRRDIFVRLPLALTVFGAQRQPPQLNKFSLFVEFVGHLLDGVAGERVRSRIPVAVGVEPPVIQRCPLDAKFF